MSKTPNSSSLHLTPLPESVPALRVELRGRTIIEASPALESLVGAPVDRLLNGLFSDLFGDAERQAIDQRLDDVVLLGADRFGALALITVEDRTVLVEVDAHYVYKGGQRVEMAFRRIPRPAGAYDPGVVRNGMPTLGEAGTAAADLKEGGALDDPSTVAAGLEASQEPEPNSAELVAPAEAEAETETVPRSAAQEAGNPDDQALPAEPEPVPEGSAAAEPEPPAAVKPTPDGSAAAAEPESRAEPEHTSDDAAAAAEPESSAEPAPVPQTTIDAPDPAPASDTPQPGSPAEDGAQGALAIGVLDAARVAALAVDAAGTITMATSDTERMFGIPIARLRNAPFLDLFKLPGPARDALEKARAAGARQSVLAELAEGEGQVVLEWIPNVEPGSGIALLTPDKQSEKPEGSTEVIRLQARLVSFVAHDVRESLSAVYCGLRNVMDLLPADARERPAVETALKESERANRIVRDVLLVSRPGRLNRVELDSGGILAETLERFKPKAEQAGLDLSAELAPDVPIRADLSNLDRAFANLLENAIHATPEGGRVRVISQPEDRGRPGVLISFCDTGKGIPAHAQPNIFEPFVTNKEQGTGLGLAITRRVVLDHGGQIDLVSREGEGTTFHVWLPRAG